MSSSKPAVLILAGSDSSAGAGIQQDILAVREGGAHPLTVITALTAQGPSKVISIQKIPQEFILSQVEAVLENFSIQAIKTGMLPDEKSIQAVLTVRKKLPKIPMVVDPVMVATSGSPLTTEDTLHALFSLLKTADLITPNLKEAQKLLNTKDTNPEILAKKLEASFGGYVLVKGSEGKDNLLRDYLWGEGKGWPFPHLKRDGEFHGTGCYLASSIAAHLAQQFPMHEAVKLGIFQLLKALERAFLPKNSKMRYF